MSALIGWLYLIIAVLSVLPIARFMVRLFLEVDRLDRADYTFICVLSPLAAVFWPLLAAGCVVYLFIRPQERVSLTKGGSR